MKQSKWLTEDIEDIVKTMNKDGCNLAKKKFLITGATGLVGSILCKSLLAMNDSLNWGVHVYGVIRDKRKAEEIYGNMILRSDFSLVKGDITNPLHMEGDVDYIIHCASVTASKLMISQPVETIMTAISGTYNMLELAKEKKVKSFVYVSSMEMYGSFNDLQHDVSEEDLGYINPLAIRSNYPESKRLCENMCIAFSNEYGVHTSIARLAQTFGAGILVGENRVFAQFARSAIKGEDIILHTKGLSEGNYCYTSDAIKGLLTIALKGKCGEAYNVSNPETHTTISEMAKMVASEFSNGKSKVIYDIPQTNSFGYAADTKMKLASDKLQKLGWKPEVGLKEAYRRLIGYIKEVDII